MRIRPGATENNFMMKVMDHHILYYTYIIIQMPQVAGQMPTMIAAPPPDHPAAPHDFLILALVTTIICSILNLVSLAFGVPAIILAVMVT